MKPITRTPAMAGPKSRYMKPPSCTGNLLKQN
jgi:hypothetical protein